MVPLAVALVVHFIMESEEKCVRFFIRRVSFRDTQTLCGWIAEMVANTAHVTTDQWGGYHGLRDLCAARGKTIVHHRVNHSAGFKNAEGKHTNVVECMHHQVRAIFDRVGQEWEKRTCRIMAACAVAQPGRDSFDECRKLYAAASRSKTR